MKTIMHSKVKLILPVIIWLLCSCTDNIIFVRYTIPPPDPDTTAIYTPIAQLQSIAVQVDTSVLIKTKDEPPVWPPEPDTTRVALGNAHRIGKIEVLYFLPSPAASDNLAYIVDSNDKIIDSTSVKSADKPVNLMYGKYYQIKASFQLNKKVTSPMVKVTIPNKPAFPDGKEVFYIKFE